jgi:cytoskeletal protein CcmA (bactofilin family)
VAPVSPPAPPTAAPSGKGWNFRLGVPSSELNEPHKRGSDRTVMGGDVRVAKGETVRDLTVFGGNVDIEGEASGDVTVFGGEVHVGEGARVHGDATVFGGTLRLEPGAHVDGDVSCVGGELDRDPGAAIGGDVNVKGGTEGGGDVESEHAEHGEHARSFVRRSVDQLVSGVRLAAMLFVLGTMLLALAGRRLEPLRIEFAARPMRSIALGLLGGFGAVLAIIALCVTIIGIPVAVVAAMVGGFAVLGSMCAVLEVVGEGLLRHRTENPYVHLAVGCALFVALSAVPWVGPFVVVAVVLAGVGVLVATRGAGYFVRKNGPQTPYRGTQLG